MRRRHVVAATTIVALSLAACAGDTQDLAPAPPPTGDNEPANVADDNTDNGPAPTTTTADGELAVHFLDVGQADATLLHTGDVAVLIDQGDWQRSDVTEHLDRLGIDKLALSISTHGHADHIGQLDQVLEQLDVAKVWWSPYDNIDTQTFARAQQAVNDSGVDYLEPRAGHTWERDGLRIDVVNPHETDPVSDIHDSNLAVRVTFGEATVLLTGDAERDGERRMLDHAADLLTADVLQLGHHGSSTSTTPDFLTAVDPDIAVYSAGDGNTYDHPHDEVLVRVEQSGADLYGTDVHGTVVATTNGSDWDITTELDGNIDTSDIEPPADPEPPEDQNLKTGGDGCDDGQVNINTASEDELAAIIHINEERAGQVLDLRPFTNVSNLDRVSGIAEARVADILDEGLACAASVSSG